MASDIHLDVPFVTQIKVGAHAGGGILQRTLRDAGTPRFACLATIDRQVRGLVFPNNTQKSKKCVLRDGSLLNATAMAAEPMGARYEQLKTNEGLVSVSLPESHQWDCLTLCRLLRDKGPLFVRRGFRNAEGKLRGGHIIVLVGCKISSQIVIYHCPTKGPDLEMGIDEFNNVFKWTDKRAAEYSMMYLPPNRTTKGSVREMAQIFGG